MAVGRSLSSLLHGSPLGLLECPLDMAVASPRMSDLAGSKAEGAMSFMTYLWKLSFIICAMFYYYTVSPFQV